MMVMMVKGRRDSVMVAMGWRPAWCVALSSLLLLTSQGARTQDLGNHTEENYTIAHDYPAHDYDYDDVDYGSHLGSFTPHLSNTTLYKCRCGADQVWDGEQCQDAITHLFIIDFWTNHRILANTSDFGDVKVSEVTCPEDHAKVVLEYEGLIYDLYLLEYGGVLWHDAPYRDYCMEHTLDADGEPTAMVAHVCLPPPPVSLCCPRGHAILPNGTCYPDDAALDVPLSMTVGDQQVTWVIEGDGVVTNISCGNEDTYYKKLTEANVSLVYSPRGVMLQWLPPSLGNLPKDSHEYCLGVELGEPGHAPQYSSMFCYTDRIAAHQEACHNATCFRKCCPDHHITVGVECIRVENSSQEWTPTFHHRDSLAPYATPPGDLKMVHGFPFCGPSSSDIFKMRPDETEGDRFYLLEDGTLRAPAFPGVYAPTHYCIDNFIAEDHPLQELALLCFSDNQGCVLYVTYPVLLAVSCVFLTITLLVYVSVPELHAKVHGKCLVSHVTALLLAYLCLIIVQWSSSTLPDVACKIMASLTHVSFLAAFFWLNVMCFDIWWTLKSMRPVAETGELSRLRFKLYSIYSWGCPALISFVAVIVDSLPEDFDVVRPGFGVNKCWFSGQNQLWAYFYGFILALVIANIILFCQVAYILIMAQNDPILQRTRQQNRERMWLYIKLFVVMGLTWIMEVISWQEGSCEPWIIPDVINALQGFSIFLIFICKRNMLKRIRNNWEPYLRRMKLFVGSSRQPDLVKGKGVQDTSSFTSSVNRPSSQSGASQRTVQSQISLDTSSAFRKLSTSSLVSTTGVQIHNPNSLCMDTITEASEMNHEGNQPALGDTQPTLGDTQPTLGDTQPALGDTQPALGDTQPTLGDAQPTLGDTHPAQPTLGDTQPTQPAQPTITEQDESTTQNEMNEEMETSVNIEEPLPTKMISEGVVSVIEAEPITTPTTHISGDDTGQDTTQTDSSGVHVDGESVASQECNNHAFIPDVLEEQQPVQV